MQFEYQGTGEIKLTFVNRSYRAHGSYQLSANDSGSVEITCSFQPSPAWYLFYNLVLRLRWRHPLMFRCSLRGEGANGEQVKETGLLVQDVHDSTSVGHAPQITLQLLPRDDQLTVTFRYGTSVGLTKRRYFLATPFFLGTTWVTSSGGGGSLSLITFNTQWGTLDLSWADDYLAIQAQVRHDLIPRITSYLDVHRAGFGSGHELAHDVCDLLALALRSDVQWVYIEFLDKHERVVKRVHRAVTLRRPRLGHRSIPDSEHLKSFLESCLSNHTHLRDNSQYHIGLLYYLEAQYTEFIQIKYALTFIALEYIRSALAEYFPEGPNMLSSQFTQVLDESLRANLMTVLEDHFPLAATWNRSALLHKLANLNQPAGADCIQALLNSQRITGFQAAHSRLRNNLFHSGEFGEPFGQVHQLYISLNRITLELILRSLGYRGAYLDYANGWAMTPVP